MTEPLDPKILHEYAVKAAEYIEEAGIRYTAATDDHVHSILGWCIAIFSTAHRVDEYLVVLCAGPEQMTAYLSAMSDRPDYKALVARLAEARTLQRLGESGP